jgi:hypothetical protein
MKLSSKFNKQQTLLKIATITLVLFSWHLGNSQVLPLTDPQNSGNWVLNPDVSDEFDGGTLDEIKWQIQGKDGIYKSNFIGRQPSQFSPNNAFVEADKLKIRTKWEPTFPFNRGTTFQCGQTYSYENITTAAVISREQFHYGYMEIKSKAAKAEVTSSFWTTGNKSEMDMFEMFGDPKDLGTTNNAAWKKRLKFNMISWDPANYYYLPDGNGPAHTRNIQANDNTADAFHVYGFDWTPDYVKVYIDGVFKSEILKSVITQNGADPDAWVTNVPYWLWFDSETFCWLGLPEAADLPVDYEIEYIRVWEKKNLLNSKFFAYEGSIDINGSPANWFIPGSATPYMNIGTEKPYRWYNSLKFSHVGALTDNAVAFSPFGSLNFTSGDYTLSLKVWLEPASTVSDFQVILENPFQTINFDVSGIETGKWVELSQNFTRTSASASNDRLRIRITPADASSGSSIVYFDDIFINTNSALGIDDLTINKSSSKIYPNPINTSNSKFINVSSPNATRVTLYNISGAKLIEQNKLTEPLLLNVDNLTPGLYFVSITSDLGIETKKIIIQ